jgi:hypothetical protein
VWALLVAATIVAPGRSVHVQALEPRSYANTPVGINFVLLGYGYSEGGVGFDASSPIKDAKVNSVVRPSSRTLSSCSSISRRT